MNYLQQVTVKQHNKTYEEGNFIANLFFKGVYHNSKANLSGSVMVCDNRAKINDTKCFSALMSVDDFQWPDNLVQTYPAFGRA
jgi:hypothetical protein